MRMIYDRSYFARRAEQERQAAADAVNPHAQRAHQELAERYEGLAIDPATPQTAIRTPDTV